MNRHVLITGAGKGVGRQVAQLFHAQGDKVSLMARTEGDLASLARELGTRAFAHPADLTDPKSVARALQAFEKAHGPVDVLVNNAGVGAYKAFVAHEEAEIQRMIDTNFTGLVLLTHAVVKSMVPRKTGTLIHVASDLARRPLANMAVYAATKHALAGFSQSLARELRTHNVKSVLVNPGLIDTAFHGGSEGDLRGDGALSAKEVAETILFVANSPARVLLDEVSVHKMGQDF